MPNSSRGIVSRLLDDRLEAEQALAVLLEQHQQRVLHERQSRRRLEVAARLLGQRVRRVVRRDHVDHVREYAVAQRRRDPPLS